MYQALISACSVFYLLSTWPLALLPSINYTHAISLQLYGNSYTIQLTQKGMYTYCKVMYARQCLVQIELTGCARTQGTVCIQCLPSNHIQQKVNIASTDNVLVSPIYAAQLLTKSCENFISCTNFIQTTNQVRPVSNSQNCVCWSACTFNPPSLTQEVNTKQFSLILEYQRKLSPSHFQVLLTPPSPCLDNSNVWN